MRMGDTGTGMLMAPFDITALTGYQHCYFVLRADYRIKSGGDVDLARQLGRAASAAGATVSILGVDELPAHLDKADLLFIFNIDRPYDAAVAIDHAHPDGRVLLYTLHHPSAGVAKYLTRVRGIKRWLGRAAGAQPDRYEALVDIAKGAKDRNLERLRVAIHRRHVINRLLARCELLVTSQAELDEIRSSFDLTLQTAWLLPHPVAPYAPGAAVEGFRYVLVPGRIEPRKNQLAALQALAAMGLRERGYEVILAGGRGADRAYFRQTVNFALASGTIYVSQLPKSLFFPTVSGAALVVNASFFEVTSLIDLYAIANRIPLVTTVHSYYDSIPSMRQVDPLGWRASPSAELRDAINAMLAVPAPG